MGQTGFQGVKQDNVNCDHLNPVQSSRLFFHRPIAVKGRSKRKIKKITNFIWHKIGFKPVIQIDFSPFCSSVLFDFTLPALHSWPPKLPDELFYSLDILSLMIWMPTWLPLSSSKGSSSWLSWIVFYQGLPLFRRACKTPYCTKTHFDRLRLSPRSY